METKGTTLVKNRQAKKVNKTSDSSEILSKVGKKTFIILLIIVVITAVFYFLKNQFIVAVVNGKPISRLALIRELEKQAGKKTLDSLITKTLILQEAKKQNVTVRDDEIAQELKKLEENFSNQGQDLNQLLESQGMARDELSEQIRIQKIVEKIVGKEINVADQEVDDYIKENEKSISKDLDMEKVKESVKEQLLQQKTSEKVQLWIESLHDKAKINYFLKI